MFKVRTFVYFLDGEVVVAWIVTEPSTWMNCGNKVRTETEVNDGGYERRLSH